MIQSRQNYNYCQYQHTITAQTFFSMLTYRDHLIAKHEVSVQTPHEDKAGRNG